MNADPYVMKYFPYLMTKEQTMVMIERIKTHFEKNGFGLYAVDEPVSYTHLTLPTMRTG